MSPSGPTSRLAIASMLALVGGVFGWLLFGFAGDHGGRVAPVPAEEATGGRGAPVADYVFDLTGQWTLTDVERLAPSDWQRWSGRGFLAGRRGEVLWLRLRWPNAGGQPRHGVLENDDYFLDRMDAWIGEGAAREHLLAGEGVPAVDKALPGREVAVPVTVPARGGQTVLLRCEDYFALYARPVWWPEERAFHLARHRLGIAEAVYFGGLLALLGYNVLLWLRLRLTDTGHYVGYLGSTAAFMLLARAQLPALGWALGSPGLETALTAMLILGAFFLTQFARVFLEVAGRFPRADRGLRGWGGALLVLLGALLVATRWPHGLGWMQLTALAVGLTHAGLLGLALVAWRAGVRQARFFVLSFGCLFAGSLPLVLVWFLGTQFRDATMRGLMIGSTLEMLLLSLAVADRFAQAQREKTAAQQKLVEETEQRRVIEEAYTDELEVEVRERTHELEAANTDKDRMLIALGHDLRSPLAALTQRAEQLRGASRSPVVAAEGEVLREFSGDVAGAGRQMLLLIEDIVLWARLRTGAQPAASAHRVGALVTPVVTLHRPLADRRGVTLTVEVDESLVAWTDLVLAQTMVRNLVGNAVKFARSRVDVSACAEGPTVGITVRDDGPGLPAAVLARLRGETSAEGEASEGGGMGLRLTQEIGGTLGARIAAVAVAGGGTAMRVSFPTAAAEPTTEARA